MMQAIEIIREKVSPDGLPIDRRVLQEAASRQVSSGQSIVLQYGETVFTVDLSGTVHLYSMGRPGDLLHGLRRFHKDVWWLTPWTSLRAPIRIPELQRIALSFGWVKGKTDSLGYTWFTLTKGV